MREHPSRPASATLAPASRMNSRRESSWRPEIWVSSGCADASSMLLMALSMAGRAISQALHTVLMSESLMQRVRDRASMCVVPTHRRHLGAWTDVACWIAMALETPAHGQGRGLGYLSHAI